MSAAPARDIQQRSFQFGCQIVRFCDGFSSRGAVARTLGLQLLRAGTGIGSNLEEAAGAQSRADFISKCNIALKEARETLYWLRLLGATLDPRGGELAGLKDEGDQLVAILTAIVKNARSNRDARGSH